MTQHMGIFLSLGMRLVECKMEENKSVLFFKKIQLNILKKKKSNTVNVNLIVIFLIAEWQNPLPRIKT